MNVGMSNPPPSRIKDFFATPALSLTLAGVFRGSATASEVEVEEGEAESVGREDAVDISSENTGPGDDDAEDFAEEDGDDDDSKRKKKRRKKYHRHTIEQIREMEALFKESPHPDEKQRQELSKRLGLAPRQVKFWFQNRRTQIKAIQERHENSLLKTEMEKLHEENQKMRQTIKKSNCPNCGFATSTRDSIMDTEEQQLRIENARLKAEIEKLRGTSGRIFRRNASPDSSCSAGNDKENMSCLDSHTGIFGLEKQKIMENVNHALEELKQMAFSREPLWVKSVESGREMLNYDEYMRQFCPENSSNNSLRRSIEASRDTGNLFLDVNRLIQAFMDVNQWKEMFPGMISRASTVGVICNGEGDNKDGTIQLMFAEIQMMTPLVPTREVYFVRHCKKLNPETWAIVDVSIDTMEQHIDASLAKCRKRPSGCIIEDKSNGHCKVTWVEHMEWHRSIVHTTYRSIVNGGMAFEARRWIATLQLQCERIIFFMATNVPTKDSSGVTTLAGRKSLLRLAQRMSSNFCLSIAASNCHSWTKLSSRGGEDIRMASRKNLNDPGEPIGLILCAVSSVCLPISPTALFDFLKDDTKRSEWDIMSTGVATQIIANIAKGQDRGNSVTIHASKSKDSNMWIIQDSCTNAYESMIVYAPVDISRMQSVLTGCDSSSIPILSSGFAILPDELESRSMIISTRREEKEGGSILTVAFQILANASPTAKLTAESLETVNTLISCTLQNIKASFQCEDGT